MQSTTGDLAGVIERAKAYDRVAFTELYRRAVAPVYRYIGCRVDSVEEAEELTQEVFVSALAGIQSLRAETEAGLYGWLFQIARHKIADHLRRRYRLPGTDLAEVADREDGSLRPAEVVEIDAERTEVRQALEHLTAEQREVVVYKYFLDYDNERIAHLIGKTANAVNQLHHRALGSLYRHLTRMENVKR